jgi:hypothetical protein
MLDRACDIRRWSPRDVLKRFMDFIGRGAASGFRKDRHGHARCVSKNFRAAVDDPTIGHLPADAFLAEILVQLVPKSFGAVAEMERKIRVECFGDVVNLEPRAVLDQLSPPPIRWGSPTNCWDRAELAAPRILRGVIPLEPCRRDERNSKAQVRWRVFTDGDFLVVSAVPVAI